MLALGVTSAYDFRHRSMSEAVGANVSEALSHVEDLSFDF